jgi:hypothetical protein
MPLVIMTLPLHHIGIWDCEMQTLNLINGTLVNTRFATVSRSSGIFGNCRRFHLNR